MVDIKLASLKVDNVVLAFLWGVVSAGIKICRNGFKLIALGLKPCISIFSLKPAIATGKGPAVVWPP